MKTIYKYPLVITDLQTIQLPISAVILTAKEQNGILQLWAEVETDNELEERIIEIFGSGNPIERHRRVYIATIIQTIFVWHIYERMK